MVLNVFHIFPLSLQQDCETERGYTVWFQRSHPLYSASQRILNHKHCIVITDFSWLSLPLTTSILRSKNRGLTYLCTHSMTLNKWISRLIMALLYYSADVCTLSPNASVILDPFGGLGEGVYHLGGSFKMTHTCKFWCVPLNPTFFRLLHKETTLTDGSTSCSLSQVGLWVKGWVPLLIFLRQPLHLYIAVRPRSNSAWHTIHAQYVPAEWINTCWFLSGGF